MNTSRLGLRRRVAALVLTVVAAGMTAQEAHAQTFFDYLFGGGARRQQERNRDRGVQSWPDEWRGERKTQSKPAQISAPAYYTYRADALVRVKAPKIVAAGGVVVGPQLMPAGADFGEAVAALGDFDLTAEKEIAAAIASHYSKSPQFIWVSGFGPNGRAEQAVRVLGDAASHGLDPADYSVTVPAATFDATDMAARQKELAAFELALSARVLRYVEDATRGRIDPNRISGYHDFAPKPLDLDQALDRLSHTQDVAVLIESYHPRNAEYQELRVELETLRGQAENDIVVDPKLLLKPGQSSPELPKIIALIERTATADFATKYAVALAINRNAETYSEELVPLVKEAQQAAGLKGDGVIGPRTVQALAGVSKADRIVKVEVALEQLRWLPSDLGARRVFINQPAYTAAYFENGAEKLSMRTVIGKKSNQTSFFQDVIEQVDYNPYWGVPQSIIVNEMLPRLRRDPGYLDRAGYEVTDSKGRKISSSSIDWGAYGGKVPYSVRQTPSEANALGELKILFPNKHAIYMHDTPQKALFKRDMRAFSHGCVRLAEPREMAAALLGKDVSYVARKLAAGHSSEKIPGNIPVYVAYFTAWPDKTGAVQFYDDVYDRDARVMDAIETTEAVRAPAS